MPIINSNLPTQELRCRECIYYGMPESTIAVASLSFHMSKSHGVCTAKPTSNSEVSSNGSRVPYTDMTGIAIDLLALAECSLRDWRKTKLCSDEVSSIGLKLTNKQLSITKVLMEYDSLKHPDYPPRASQGVPKAS